MHFMDLIAELTLYPVCTAAKNYKCLNLFKEFHDLAKSLMSPSSISSAQDDCGSGILAILVKCVTISAKYARKWTKLSENFLTEQDTSRGKVGQLTLQ